jgi:hypothetical protein
MATIVGAIGTSHSPVLPTTPELWADRAGQDRFNPELYGPDGRIWPYDDLLARRDARAAELATPARRRPSTGWRPSWPSSAPTS